MNADEVLELYDSYWFEHSIFKGKRNPSNVSPLNPDGRILEEPTNSKKCLAIPTVDSMRSMSDNSFKFDSYSPKSVLSIQPSHTGSSTKDVVVAAKDSNPMMLPKGKKLRKIRKHKSLSELELEEVKGFMDLGFVFTEEDRHSSLASLIPGLQRLGKMEEEEEEDEFDDPKIRRPYLSERWEYLERKERLEEPLRKWKLPDTRDAESMKESLKCWAHAVVQTVR